MKTGNQRMHYYQPLTMGSLILVIEVGYAEKN